MCRLLSLNIDYNKWPINPESSEKPMPEIDLIDLYTPHNWKVHQVRINDEFKSLREIVGQECNLKSCASDGGFAVDYYKRNGTIRGLFFFDVEQVFMDLDGCYGEMMLGRLQSPWRGHAPGSLVFAVAKGVDEGFFMVGVAAV